MPYAPSYAKFLDDPNFPFTHGAYGRRIAENANADQLEAVIRILTKDPDSRQALVTMWDAQQDLEYETRDKPCTVCLQFIVREGKLELITFMRSNDLWLGFPYDVFCFTGIQRHVATELGREVGSYYHMVGSLHLYEKDWKKAAEAATPNVNYATAEGGVTRKDLETLSTYEQNLRRGIPAQFLCYSPFMNELAATLEHRWLGHRDPLNVSLGFEKALINHAHHRRSRRSGQDAPLPQTNQTPGAS